MSQLSPSITSPRSGTRSRNRPPSDLTGRRHEALLREQAARKAAEQAGPIDVEAIKRDEYTRGWDDGYDAGVQAVIRQLTDAGVIDANEPVIESQDVD